MENKKKKSSMARKCNLRRKIDRALKRRLRKKQRDAYRKKMAESQTMERRNEKKMKLWNSQNICKKHQVEYPSWCFAYLNF